MATKPSMTSPLGAMGETFDLIQKMWGGMGMPTPGNFASMGMPQQMPSMLAPTVDINELDKRIADLRAVAQWLELNASMLRTTIQTLEVQRATIATLKGISGAMLAPIMGTAEPARPAFTPPAPDLSSAFAAAAKHEEPAPAEKPARKRKKPAPQGPSLADDALNPAAWWHTLQDQFARIAAVASDSAPAKGEPAPIEKKKRPSRD
ncbi:MAG TPA: hypothetical protein PLE54_14380 [Burkholderiaceae bacterium]|nr:hypothetical protein [Burkholderiaceae bacterium]